MANPAEPQPSGTSTCTDDEPVPTVAEVLQRIEKARWDLHPVDPTHVVMKQAAETIRRMARALGHPIQAPELCPSCEEPHHAAPDLCDECLSGYSERHYADIWSDGS